MYRLISKREDGSATGPRKYFAEYSSLTEYLVEHMDSNHEFPTVELNYNDKIAYVIHSGVHPDDFDYQGKSAQEVLEHDGHVIPADDRLRAIRDIEALKRRTGELTVYQVMIVNPGGETEVMYLQTPQE
jgi:hypothetical protein